MTIKEFIEKWFKNGVHKEGIEQYFNVYGVSQKSLGLYIRCNFGNQEMGTEYWFRTRSPKELDEYMEDLLELQS